jgi:PTH1 family peptidyl-tRNA hydrolase
VTGPWLLVGLGNPGARYAGTRHNVGEMIVRHIAQIEGLSLRSNRKVRSDTAEFRVGEHRCVLAVPHSYMNESGGPVSSLVQYFSAEPAQLLVIHDEIDLPFGALRVKFGGGDNGHNGLKSIRAALSTGEWFRIRVGVGRGRSEAVDHVLSRFNGSERAALPDLLDRGAACAESLVTRGLDATQNEFNS